jgi:hypothetical protein
MYRSCVAQRVKQYVSRETTIRNDVMIMIENTIANDVNDVVTNDDNDDATTTHDATNDVTTTTTRATTRALRDVRIAKNAKTKTIRDDANNEIVIVRTSTNALRIDHTTCAHENSKNARSKCRASIARANDKKTK